jgi:hypothetical protein
MDGKFGKEVGRPTKEADQKISSSGKHIEEEEAHRTDNNFLGWPTPWDTR